MIEQYLGNEQSIYTFTSGKEIILINIELQELLNTNKEYLLLLKDYKVYKNLVKEKDEYIDDFSQRVHGVERNSIYGQSTRENIIGSFEQEIKELKKDIKE